MKCNNLSSQPPDVLDPGNTGMQLEHNWRNARGRTSHSVGARHWVSAGGAVLCGGFAWERSERLTRRGECGLRGDRCFCGLNGGCAAQQPSGCRLWAWGTGCQAALLMSWISYRDVTCRQQQQQRLHWHQQVALLTSNSCLAHCVGAEGQVVRMVVGLARRACLRWAKQGPARPCLFQQVQHLLTCAASALLTPAGVS